MNNARRGLLIPFLALAGTLIWSEWLLSQPPAAADPFKLGATEKGYIQDTMQGNTSQYSYPAPQIVPQAPVNQPVVVHPKPHLNGSAEQTQRPPVQRHPIPANVVTSVELPRDFLGAWAVAGTRQKVEAQPEFEAGAQQAFAGQTQNIWNISGNPQAGYSIGSNSGMSTQLWVDKVQGGTAFIRYQHPVGKTMAQEAVVMSLVPGGMQFNGLERISIVKEGQGVRAKVTYQLMGQRQR